MNCELCSGFRPKPDEAGESPARFRLRNAGMAGITVYLNIDTSNK